MNISEDRRKEIIQMADSRIVPFEESSTDVAIGFESGAEWADTHPSKEAISRILELGKRWEMQQQSTIYKTNDKIEYIISNF